MHRTSSDRRHRGGAVALLSTDKSSTGDTIKVTDMLGQVVDVKKNPEHVACVSRTTYDMLVAFGLGDRIDGAYYSLFDNEWTSILYPDSKNQYSYEYEPSSELLLERNVDLVLCPESYIAQNLREHGLAAITVSLYGNPSYGPYIFFLANLAEQLWPDVAGVKEKAEQWKSELQGVIDDVQSMFESMSESRFSLHVRSLYYIRGDKDRGICYTDKGRSFNEYVFDLLGTSFLGSTFGTNKPSTEALLAADPEVIVIGGIYQHSLKAVLTTDSTWENISAVKSGEIYTIGIGFSPMEQLGAFSSVFVASMANALYPDYAHFDTEKMLKGACFTYFGISLTDEQAQYMLSGLGPDGNPMV